MKRNVIFLALIILVVTALLMAGKFMSKGGSNSTVSAIFQAAPEGPKKGDPAPDFTLKTLDGKDLKLSSLHGKAVMINFWATWCEPCKIETPWLVELQKKYGDKGLQILGVAVDDAGEKAIADFAHKMQMNYPVLLGTEKVADLYGGVEGLPTNFILDRSGKVVGSEKGLVSESVLVEHIEKALGTAGSESKTSTASAK
ncbi:MAG TPA: TlpA disulfide reductase family protein [Terriglobales bacterium]|nr:TlpA disulfide reductase family protein [Terriglobales bacterium]